MLRLRVTQRLPAAHEERPAGPQHDGRGEGELNPVRQRRVDQAVTADEMAAHLQDDRRQREHEADPEAARHVGKFGIGRRIEARDLRAPAPCRRSGSFRGRPGGSPDASGRCRSCLPARRLSACCLSRDKRRDRRRIWCGSRPSRNDRSRRDSRSGACWSRGSRSCRRRGRARSRRRGRDDRGWSGHGRRGCGRRSRQPLATRRLVRRFRSRSSSRSGP